MTDKNSKNNNREYKPRTIKELKEFIADLDEDTPIFTERSISDSSAVEFSQMNSGLLIF
jgi:hypothetical protein